MAKLFQGIVNKPVELHTLEFKIEQKDKIKKFIDELIIQLKNQKIKSHIFSLVEMFVVDGATEISV